MIGRILPCLLVAAGLLIGTTPARGDPAAQPGNWDAVAREAIPKIEEHFTELPDFVRVYEKGSCTIDINIQMAGTYMPMNAQATFGFDDKNRDGKLNQGELEWRQGYASAPAVAMGVEELKKELFQALVQPPSRMFQASPVKGQRENGGYALELGTKVGAEDVPLTMHVGKDGLIHAAEARSSAGSATMSYTYMDAGGGRSLCTGTSTQLVGTSGGEASMQYSYSYLPQDGTFLPETILKVYSMSEPLSGMYVELTSTLAFRDWQLQKRAQPLPQGPAVSPPVARVPPRPAPQPPEVVQPPVEETPPVAVEPVPPAGRQEAEALTALLRKRYLSLSPSGRRQVGLTLREDFERSQSPSGTPDELELVWTAPGGYDSGPFFELANREQSALSILFALQHNPYLDAAAFFDVDWLVEQASLERAPDGSVTVTRKGTQPPEQWRFSSDGTLLSRTEKLGEKLTEYTYQWMNLAGGLLLQRVEYATQALGYDVTMVYKFEYRLYGDLLLPSELITGFPRPVALGAEPGDNEILSYTVVRARTDRGDELEPGEELIEEGATLEGAAPVLPGAPSAVTTAAPIPVERPEAALPSATEIGRRLDARLERLDVLDIASTVKLTRASSTTAYSFYWLAPGRLEITSGPQGAAPDAIVLLLGEALGLNPLLRSFEASFEGGSVLPLEGGAVEVSVPIARGVARRYRLRQMPPASGAAGLAAECLESVTVLDRDGKTLATARLTLAAQPDSRALAASLVLQSPEAGSLSVGFRYTRAPGFVFLKRLIVERKRAEDDPAEPMELVFDDVRANQGLAAARFQGTQPPVPELFE